MMKYLNKPVLVTNYKEGFKGVPILSLDRYKNKRLRVEDGQLVVNDVVFMYIFNPLPYIRKNGNNDRWFDCDLIHL